MKPIAFSNSIAIYTQFNLRNTFNNLLANCKRKRKVFKGVVYYIVKMNKKIILLFGFIFLVSLVLSFSVYAESNVTENNATYYQSNNTESNSTTLNLIEEQVTCVFDNSNEIQKCYTVDNNFYCSSTNEQQSCIINVSGNNGEELGWMSSCGTYNITIIDGINKIIKFDCSVSQENAPGFGYAYAYYQCYDDADRQNLLQIQPTKSCKSYDSWINIADDLCKDKCGLAQVEVGKGVYENQTLCGLKSFGISQECHQGLLDRLANWFKNLFG